MCRIDYGLDNVGLSTLHLLVHCTEYSADGKFQQKTNTSLCTKHDTIGTGKHQQLMRTTIS